MNPVVIAAAHQKSIADKRLQIQADASCIGGIVYEAGCGHGHCGDVDYGICQGCNGKGDIEEEQPPRTLADLEQEDFDMIEAAACR